MDEMKAKYERAYNPWTADFEKLCKQIEQLAHETE